MVVAIGVALMSLSSTVSLYAQTNGTSSTTTKNIMSNVKATADESINKTTMTRQSIDESSKIRVIVIFEVKEGNKQKALDTLASLADLAKKREGIISFNIYSSTGNPNEFLIDQLWANKTAFEKHYDSPEANKDRQILMNLSNKLLENETFTEINNLHA